MQAATQHFMSAYDEWRAIKYELIAGYGRESLFATSGTASAGS